MLKKKFLPCEPIYFTIIESNLFQFHGEACPNIPLPDCFAQQSLLRYNDINSMKGDSAMEQANSQVLDFFAVLGFEEIEIEDGLTALCYEESPEGEYALITDEEGSLPDSLKVPLMFACYSAEGAFLWSTGFKNAAHFKETWSNTHTYAEKLQAIQTYRKSVAIDGLYA